MCKKSFFGFKASIVSLIYICLSGPGFSDTLIEAMETALRNNPQIQSAHATMAMQDEKVIQSKASLKPTLALDVGLDKSSNSSVKNGSGSIEGSLALSSQLLLFDGGIQNDSIFIAETNRDSSEQSLAFLEQNLLLQTVSAYHGVLKAQSFLELDQNSQSVLETELRAAQGRFAVGTTARTDVSFVESRLASSRGDVARRRGEVAIAREQYKFVVGTYPENLVDPRSRPELPKTLEDAYAQASKQNPSILIARNAVTAADAAYKQTEKVLKTPRVFLNLSTGVAKGLTSNTSPRRNAQIGISSRINLYNGGASLSAKKEAAENINLVRANLRHESNIVMQNVANAWTQLSIIRSAVAANREQVRHTELALKGVRTEARLGARSTLDVLDVEQDNLQARTSLVSLNHDLEIAAYSLLASMGILTTEYLDLEIGS